MVHKGQVCSEHVIEVDWRLVSRTSRTWAWDHFNQNLHWTVQPVEQTAIRVQPTCAIAVRSAGKTKRSGFDKSHRERSLPQHRWGARSNPKQSEIHVRDHAEAAIVSAGWI